MSRYLSRPRRCARGAVRCERAGDEQEVRVSGQPRGAERDPLVERELASGTAGRVVLVQRQDEDLARAAEESCEGKLRAVIRERGADVGPRPGELAGGCQGALSPGVGGDQDECAILAAAADKPLPIGRPGKRTPEEERRRHTHIGELALRSTERRQHEDCACLLRRPA